MAYTVVQEKTVFGNMRVNVCEVTADAASGYWDTGFAKVSGYALAPISMATAAILIKASTGRVTCSAATNGDHFYLTVYGA